jgi:hypothetical protein
MSRRCLRALGSIVALAAITATGCGGTAVLIAQTPSGGVIGLEGDHSEAMADARRQMSEHCRGAYRIVGDKQARSGDSPGRTFTEHQVEFACGAEPMPPR